MVNVTKTILLLSYICLASVSAAIITPALPVVATFFNISKAELGWVVSIFLFGYVFGQLIYGPLANRFGRLNALRSGLLINCIGILLCLLAVWIENYFLLLIGRCITALGAAAGLVCTYILIRELFDEHQAKAIFSFSVMSFTIGIGVAVTLGGLITQYLGWENCFWLLLIHGIIMFILTWQFPETLKNPQSLQPMILLQNYSKALKNSDLIIFSLIAGGTSCMFSYCYAVAAPIYTQITLHLSPSAYGYWNILNMIGMFFGGFFCAKLLKRFEAKIILVAALLLQIPCFISLILLLFSHSPTVIWFFLTTTALYFFTSFTFATATFFATSTITDKASGSSIMSFIIMASAMLSVIILGYLPFEILPSFIIVLVVVYIFVLLISTRRLIAFFR